MVSQTASASLRPLPTRNASDDAAVGPSLLHGRGWPWVCAPTLTPTLVREAIIGIRRQKLPAVEELGSAGSFFCNPVISREHFQRIVAIAREDNGPDYQVPHYEVGDSIKVPAAWMIEQCKDLLAHGVPAVHFYTMGKTRNIREVLKVCF